MTNFISSNSVENFYVFKPVLEKLLQKEKKLNNITMYM